MEDTKTSTRQNASRVTTACHVLVELKVLNRLLGTQPVLALDSMLKLITGGALIGV